MSNHPRRLRRTKERIGEKVVATIAYTAVVAMILIFAFLLHGALPVLFDPETADVAGTAELLLPDQSSPEPYAWQPISDPPRFSVWPLVLGTLKVALVALLLAIPLGISAAVFTSEFASRRAREIVKPAIELLAGIPSVVLGFLALTILSSLLQNIFGWTYRLNALTAGMALGVAVIPIVYSLAEDAMAAVPATLRNAAAALGASPWQITRTVVIPTALPGVAAGCLLAFGRVVGETMIVLMVSGNIATMSASLVDSVRTVAATIAAEMAGVASGSAHYHVLFALGAILFLFTFVVNLGGQAVLRVLRRRTGEGVIP